MYTFLCQLVGALICVTLRSGQSRRGWLLSIDQEIETVTLRDAENTEHVHHIRFEAVDAITCHKKEE